MAVERVPHESKASFEGCLADMLLIQIERKPYKRVMVWYPRIVDVNQENLACFILLLPVSLYQLGLGWGLGLVRVKNPV